MRFFLVLACILMLLISCTNRLAKRDEIIGSWIGQSRDVVITFDINGTFKSKNLPVEFFWNNTYHGKKINGEGSWGVKGGYIELRFNLTSLPELQSFTSEILISKNASHLYLYVWEEEEGGTRYKFEK